MKSFSRFTLAAFTVAALPVPAFAQSTVTLFGVVDTAVSYGRGSIGSKTQLTSSGYNASRLGFRGTEDLGGGMSASFWLEAGFSSDAGGGLATNSNNQLSGVTSPAGLTFNRRSTVSLAGPFGELRMGRDFSPQYWNLNIFDPFLSSGAGAAQTYVSSVGGPVYIRTSNTIGYFLPANLGGFYGQAQYYMGENLRLHGAQPSNAERDGSGAALRLGYAKGPVNVAVAASSTRYATGDIRTWNIGGNYNFDIFQLMAHYSMDRVDSPQAVTGQGWLVGAMVPVGAGQIKGSVSTYRIDRGPGIDARTDKLVLGYVHNLSKRTALYATAARTINRNGAASALNGSLTAPNRGSFGYDLGLRHAF